jgi:hypothetical protein
MCIVAAACGAHQAESKGGCAAEPQQASCETAQLQTLAAAMQSFHRDTAAWPYEATVWAPVASSPYEEIDGFNFNLADTALFVDPSPPNSAAFPRCTMSDGGGSGNPCWNGPYLPVPPGTSLGATPWLDAWHHAIMYMYLEPLGGPRGGGHSQAPNGLIVIWSLGPDGIDGFACTDGTCSIDYRQVAKSECSQPQPCDDLIVQVADSSE